MNNILILLIALPLLCSFLVLLASFISRSSLAKIFSLGGVSLSLALLFLIAPAIFSGGTFSYSVGGWKGPLGIALYMDGLAWSISLIGTIIALLALVYAGGERDYHPRFYFFFLLLLVGMQGVILTDDIFNMFVFFEILSISTYVLIAYFQTARAIRASFNYLLLSSLGIAFFLLGIGLIYQAGGVLSLEGMREVAIHLQKNSPSMFNLAVVCLVVGIGIKAAFIPLHTWLPNAHAYAPTPVSALLSAVMIKVSFLAIWRIIGIFQAPAFQYLLIWVGAFTAFLAVIWALAQTDIKKIIAYSSISQMGFIVASFGVASSLSLTASFFHIINHSLFKSLLFLSAGLVIYSTGIRDVSKLSGLGRKMPLGFFAFLVGSLSISGIPPFNGFASKSLISLSLKNYPLAAFLILLASIGTVASFSKLMRIFVGSSAGGKIKKVPTSMTLPLLILCAFSLALGILPSWGAEGISRLILPGSFFWPRVYTLWQVATSLLILAVGVIFYLFTLTSYGKRIFGYIRQMRLGLNNSLLLLIISLILFVVFMQLF